MKIETKFGINDFVIGIFDKNRAGKKLMYTISEIKAVTCYAGTQVFYYCKIVVAMSSDFMEGIDVDLNDWGIGLANDDDGQVIIRMMREDDLMPAPKDLIQFFHDQQIKSNE